MGAPARTGRSVHGRGEPLPAVIAEPLCCAWWSGTRAHVPAFITAEVDRRLEDAAYYAPSVTAGAQAEQGDARKAGDPATDEPTVPATA